MQKEGKFGGKLDAAMSKMAGKLRDCEFEEAGKMHVAIMCDHTAEVRCLSICLIFLDISEIFTSNYTK